MSRKKRSILWGERKPPSTPIEHLIARFREHLHLPDPSSVEFMMGAVAANMLVGVPVWPMLVGPPGTLKTGLLRTTTGIHGMQECASIGNEAAFLSGTPKKDRAKDATGGILNRVGGAGGVVINDFTTILSLREAELLKVLGVFRECYSGEYTRDVGSDGGRKLYWKGRVAMFAGVTGAIDQHHKVSASMGERWIYFRHSEDGNEYARCDQALRNANAPEWEDELRDLVAAFFATLDLAFDPQSTYRELTDNERYKIINYAQMAARCRSAVIRDQKNHEILAPPARESATRLSGVLGQLYKGLDAIGVSDADRWKLIRRVSLDSMPLLRRIVIDRASSGAVSVGELVKESKVSRAVMDRTIDELERHGVVVKELWDKKAYLYLSDYMADALGKQRHVSGQS